MFNFGHGGTSGIKPARPGRGLSELKPIPMDDQEFSRNADTALELLRASLYKAEETAEIEAEMNSGALKINFEEPPGTFVISPNAAVQQIWISALSTSFKLDWSAGGDEFVLLKTGEGLKPLVSRLINQHLGEEAVQLT